MGRCESKYCEKYGCYVPEGETACVSCGYDPTSKPVRRPDPLADMYARDPWAIAQYHTPLPMDYAQLVNVAPKVRQMTLNEVLDELKMEDKYERSARAMSQIFCSTAQASEAFTQLARDHQDAQKQVILHEFLWAKAERAILQQSQLQIVSKMRWIEIVWNFVNIVLWNKREKIYILTGLLEHTNV